MAHYNCQRCGVDCNTTTEHLCADIVKRRARQESYVFAVINELDRKHVHITREQAEEVVKRLLNLGIQNGDT